MPKMKDIWRGMQQRSEQRGYSSPERVRQSSHIIWGGIESSGDRTDTDSNRSSEKNLQTAPNAMGCGNSAYPGWIMNAGCVSPALSHSSGDSVGSVAFVPCSLRQPHSSSSSGSHQQCVTAVPCCVPVMVQGMQSDGGALVVQSSGSNSPMSQFVMVPAGAMPVAPVLMATPTPGGYTGYLAEAPSPYGCSPPSYGCAEPSYGCRDFREPSYGSSHSFTAPPEGGWGAEGASWTVDEDDTPASQPPASVNFALQGQARGGFFLAQGVAAAPAPPVGPAPNCAPMLYGPDYGPSWSEPGQRQRPMPASLPLSAPPDGLQDAEPFASGPNSELASMPRSPAPSHCPQVAALVEQSSSSGSKKERPRPPKSKRQQGKLLAERMFKVLEGTMEEQEAAKKMFLEQTKEDALLAEYSRKVLKCLIDDAQAGIRPIEEVDTSHAARRIPPPAPWAAAHVPLGALVATEPAGRPTTEAFAALPPAMAPCQPPPSMSMAVMLGPR